MKKSIILNICWDATGSDSIGLRPRYNSRWVVTKTQRTRLFNWYRFQVILTIEDPSWAE